jgi:hypothetical protein
MLTYAALHMAAQVLSTLDILVPQVGYSSTRVGELIQVIFEYLQLDILVPELGGSFRCICRHSTGSRNSLFRRYSGAVKALLRR